MSVLAVIVRSISLKLLLIDATYSSYTGVYLIIWRINLCKVREQLNSNAIILFLTHRSTGNADAYIPLFKRTQTQPISVKLGL